jgi:hypothetical protein
LSTSIRRRQLRGHGREARAQEQRSRAGRSSRAAPTSAPHVGRADVPAPVQHAREVDSEVSRAPTGSATPCAARARPRRAGSDSFW